MKKLVYGAIAILLIAAAINAQFEKAELEEKASAAGFSDTKTYERALLKGISTKKEYDLYLAEKKQAELTEAEAGGFSTVDEYQKAKRVGMPNKKLYDEYLSQQAKQKMLAEQKAFEAEQREIEEKRELEAKQEADRLARAIQQDLSADSSMSVDRSSFNNDVFKYKSGKVDIALICGSTQDGVEIFLAEDYNADLYLSMGKSSPPKYFEQTFRLNGLVIPIKDGSAIVDAAATGTYEKEAAYYSIGASFFGTTYMNSVDYFGGAAGDGSRPPVYIIYRDGSRVKLDISEKSLRTAEYPIEASLNDAMEYSPCRPIDYAVPSELLAARLTAVSEHIGQRVREETELLETNGGTNKF